MNGFADRGLDEGDFGSAKGLSVVKSFDAFPKTKSTYLTRTRYGGISTLLTGLICSYLLTTELRRWWVGTTSHTFAVEKGIAHTMQMNLDVVVSMRCDDVHVNVQDASGDRILAGETLHKDPTMWEAYSPSPKKGRRRRKNRDIIGGNDMENAREQYAHQEDVHDYLDAARGRKKFKSTKKLRGKNADSCRIYGSLEENKVQGDFHITARGHGYMDFNQHLDHDRFNFSHHINELSFGPFYPSLENPLDDTISTTPNHFHKFQYHLSIVPTIYTDRPSARAALLSNFIRAPSPLDPSFRGTLAFAPHTIFTNQYAVTESSQEIPEGHVPGVFVKYDIEPIVLVISEEWDGFLSLIVKCVNVFAGVLVAGGWVVGLLEWFADFRGWGKGGKRGEFGKGGMLDRGEKEGLD